MALVAIACLLSLCAPASSFAHPLGNFTINHYSRLELQSGSVRIYYVLDEAEIPTYQELSAVHPGDGLPSAAEQRTLLNEKVTEFQSSLHLSLDDRPLPIDVEAGTATIGFPPGQGGLSTMRITVWYRATLPASTSASSAFVYRDDNTPDRLGWREIVVRPLGGVKLIGTLPPTIDQSDELRSYPTDMLSSPLDVRTVRFVVESADAIGPGTAPFRIQARGPSSGIIDAATNAFTTLIAQPTLSPAFVALALVASALLGGVHALSPGHGKTIVGAYLVGARGTPRHALILGLTVTATHTSGVFALGAVTLAASQVVSPEQLYPWLSTISGLLVTAIGGRLLYVRLRAAGRSDTGHRHDVTAEHVHQHSHDLDVTHHHQPGSHDHHGCRRAMGHVHARQAASHQHTLFGVHHYEMGNDDHRHGDQPRGDEGAQAVYHDHGTGGHSHTLPAGKPVGLRSLLALGISGGLLPCPSALVVLLAAISLHRVGFGVALVVAFSVGLAGVLTGLGLLLVAARGFVTRRRFQIGAGRLLPALSALVVLVLGLVMTAEAVAQSGLVAL